VCVLAPTDAHTERTRGGLALVLMKRLCDETHRFFESATVGVAVREI
jgi:hypothetical protein